MNSSPALEAALKFAAGFGGGLVPDDVPLDGPAPRESVAGSFDDIESHLTALQQRAAE